LIKESRTGGKGGRREELWGRCYGTIAGKFLFLSVLMRDDGKGKCVEEAK